jgi:hypothetical protein
MAVMAAVLIGIAEWQMLLAGGRLNWANELPTNGGIGSFGTESILIGVIGLLTLSATSLLALSLSGRLIFFFAITRVRKEHIT